MLVSWAPPSYAVRDRLSNTLYFNVSGAVGQDPDYQALANDLAEIYRTSGFTPTARIEVRAYNMADPTPRPERAFAVATGAGGNWVAGANQVALCLSYFADRNLPRKRGRIFTGPWAPTASYASAAIMTQTLGLAQSFASLGGLNVDWSVYSPTDQDATRITDAWVDNSWDIIRSRKLASTTRQTLTGLNG